MLAKIRVFILLYFVTQMAIAQSADSLPDSNISIDTLHAFQTPEGNPYMMGIYYYNQKLYIQALEYFEKMDSNALPAGIHYLRGSIHLQLGNYNLAKNAFLQDHQVIPGRSAYKMAQCYASLRDVHQTINWLDTAYKYQVRFSRRSILTDSHFVAVRHKWKLRKETKRFTYQPAEKAIAKAERNHKQGNMAKAMASINEALKARPDMPDWYNLKARLTMQLQEYDLARKLLYKEAEYRPFDKSGTYLHIAETYLGEGEIHKGIIWSLMALNEDSLHLSLLPHIAELYILDNQYNHAHTVLTQYLSEVPVDHYAHFLKALLAENPENGIPEINIAINLSKQQTAQVPDKYYDLLGELSMKTSQ